MRAQRSNLGPVILSPSRLLRRSAPRNGNQSEEAGFQTVSPPGFEYVTKYIEFWLRFIGVHSIMTMTVEHTWDGRALDMIDEGKKRAAELAKQF